MSPVHKISLHDNERGCVFTQEAIIDYIQYRLASNN